MKKPNIDLSQEGLNKFFLNHIEKVILGGSIAALAFLFWNGWSTEKYTKTEPAKLSQLATRAKQHIDKDTWTDIAEFREGDDQADDLIEAANKYKTDADQYAVRRLIGTPKATLGLRMDPELLAATDLIARPFTSSLLIDMKYNPNYASTLSTLRSATSADGESEDSGSDQRGSAGGGVGEGGDEEDDKDKKKDEEQDPFGNSVTNVQKLEMVGIRPLATQRGIGGGSKGHPFVLDGIAVTGVVNFGEQFKKYEAAFRNAIGYYPLRDRPLYLYMEVQRRAYDANPADQEAYDNSWVDISEDFYDDVYGIERAPEVVAPAYFDQTLTRNIPPLVNYDYRNLSLHPKVASRNMVPVAMDERNVIKKFNADDLEAGMFGGGNSTNEASEGAADADGEKETNDVKDTDVNTMKGDNRVLYDKINPLSRPKADYKLVRFFDFRAPAGKSYQYRVRLWLNDPNDIDGYSKDGLKDKKNDDRQIGSAMNPSEDGGTGGTDTEQDVDDELLNSKYVALNNSLQEQEVRNRVRKKKNQLPGFNFRGLPDKNADNTQAIDAEKERRKEYQDDMKVLLESAWATDWSEPTPPVRAGGTPADFYAGNTVTPSVQRYDGFSLPRAEPMANLVTSFWSNSTHRPSGEKAYNTAIPTLKTVRRGDVLNYQVKKAHVLDPSTGAVKRIKDTRIESDAVVVDMMGGEAVDGRFNFPVEMVSEVLVMDAAGNFRLQNSREDRIGYRHSLFLPDENNEFGKARKKKKDRDDGGGLPDF